MATIVKKFTMKKFLWLFKYLLVSEVSAIVPRLNKKKNSAWSKCCYTKDEDNSPEKKREIEKKKKKKSWKFTLQVQTKRDAILEEFSKDGGKEN